MKKIILTIPEPCHQDWNQMTAVEKGRFCGSCQKTVIDFSMMSDREIAAYLKKPASTTCGRFKKEQLERQLVIPRKRIPWVRYFFQITWPAMVLFLKSCGSRNEVTGKLSIDKKQTIQYPTVDVKGLIVGGITTNTIQPEPKKDHKQRHLSKAARSIEHESLVKKDPLKLVDEFQVEQKLPSDESHLFHVVMGGLMVRTSFHSTIATEDSLEQKGTELPEQETTIYPNPVRAGHSVTISRLHGKFDSGKVHLLSSSGQLMYTFQHSSSQESSFEIELPSSLKPGLYFLQMIERGSPSSSTKKLIVQ